MSVFPGAIPPTGSATASATLAASGHTTLHNTEYNEINAIATKIGTGASTPTSGVVLRGNGTGTSAWAQVVLSTDVSGILPQANGGTGTTQATGTGKTVYDTSPTITTPTVSNPTISGGGSWAGSPTLSTPTISDFTNSNHSHANAAGGGLLNGATAITAATLPNSVLKNGLVKNRQGGTSGDATWQTSGTTNVNTSGKDVFLQTGMSVGNGSGVDVAITFPTAFTFAPLMFGSANSTGAANVTIHFNSVTTTGCNMRQVGGTGVESMAWLAIGQ